ncbi:MAG: putative ABC transport system permease protein [Psychromonas sp.]|jgi:putative ABC transport system permease protein|uniref:ABC transporter permease n=1 Tax=Psychromonas sp. TaxID=1884585 RepID=UPI0039E63C24
MSNSLSIIPLQNLAIAFIPVFLVIIILFKWSLNGKFALYALSRMLVQLLLVGYFLNYLFAGANAWIVVMLLMLMVLFASWIALGNIKEQRLPLLKRTMAAIAVGGGFTLFVITQGVLTLHPWYQVQTMIPLAGMIFANCMNSVSLSAERFYAELSRGEDYFKARKIAFQASMIPNINALFAVGLISLPGMMTGQILSGTSPFIAARYQIVVMCMIFASAGISSAYFLVLSKNKKKTAGQ